MPGLIHKTVTFAIKSIQSPFILLFNTSISRKWSSIARILCKNFGFIQIIASQHAMNAVERSDKALLEFLIKAELYHDTYYETTTPLEFAARLCDETILDMLIKANPGGKIDSLRYPNIFNDVIRFSKNSGSNVNKTLDLLLDAGININKADSSGQTPLEAALKDEQEHILAYLLCKGATEPRHIKFNLTKYERNNRCFLLLINNGFNVQIQNPNRVLHAEQTKLLATYQASTDYNLLSLPSDVRRSLLRSTYIVYEKLITKINISTKKLIGNSIPEDIWNSILNYLWEDTSFHEKIKRRLYHGAGLLHKAVITQDMPQIIDLVRLHPENINTLDVKGLTPLYYAHKVGSNQIQQLLINNGAEIKLAESGNNDETALNKKYNTLWVLKN